jgi:hypothetical protein
LPTKGNKGNHVPYGCPRSAFKAKVALEAIKGEKMSSSVKQTILRWISVLVATMIIGLLVLTTYGCGGDTQSGETASETVEKYYQLLKEKDCDGLADYINDKKPELAERRVNECKQSTNIELVSYSIKREAIHVTGLTTVVVEVIIKENGVEKTNSVTVSLGKWDDEWKISEQESRS